GPIPYFEAAEPQDVIPYDPMDKIYDDFFVRLTQATEALKALPAGTKVYDGYDLMYDGNIDNWIKFANSLRLRLALRISDVDPTRAKAEAEAAVASGVMEENTHNASLLKSLNGNDINGLSQVAMWNEFTMSSTIASYLKGYDDPRLGIYFQPSVDGEQFNSLRNGVTATDLGVTRNQAASNSNVGTYWVQYRGSVEEDNVVIEGNLTQRLHVMCAAESYFLRAEGALNGWNMGADARNLYEEGVKTSLEQWGVTDAATIDAYLTSTDLPAAPGDYHNSPAVANTPIAWAAVEAMQREQI